MIQPSFIHTNEYERVSAEQVKRLIAIALENGWTVPNLVRWVREEFCFEHLHHIDRFERYDPIVWSIQRSLPDPTHELESPWDIYCSDNRVRWWFKIEGNVHKFKPEFYVPIEMRDEHGNYQYY